MRRIANAEGALGFNDLDNIASLAPPTMNSALVEGSASPSSSKESLEERSARLFRLYLELGRPRNNSSAGSEETSIDTAQLLSRAATLDTLGALSKMVRKRRRTFGAAGSPCGGGRWAGEADGIPVYARS